MARKLKVFAADLGFVSAVVAAPSRRAALDAWGVHDDLFARGSAREIAADDVLIAEARASPGEVLRKPIASGAQIVQSAKRPVSERKIQPAETEKALSNEKVKASRPPSRAALDRADAAMRSSRAARADALIAFDTAQADLDRRRTEELAKRDKALKSSQSKRNAARAAYDSAMKAWGG